MFAMALLLGAPDVANRSLAEGMRLYDASDFPGALQALTQALRTPSSRRELARIHLYIGLIQHRYDLAQDAEASFQRALDYDARARLPKSATSGAKALFRKVLKARSAEPLDRPEPRAEDSRRRRTSGARREPRSERSVERTRTSTVSREDWASVGGARTSRDDQGGPSSASPGVPWGRDGSADESPPSSLELGSAPEPGLTGVLPPVPYPAEPHESGAPIAGWVAIGVGVLAAASGVTLGGLSLRNARAARAQVFANRADQLYDTAVRERTLAIVSLGVGGVSFGLAAVLLSDL